LYHSTIGLRVTKKRRGHRHQLPHRRDGLLPGPPQTRKPRKPETPRNSKTPKTRNSPKPENPDNPKLPGTRKPRKPETQSPKPASETRNPKPATETRNPQPESTHREQLLPARDGLLLGLHCCSLATRWSSRFSLARNFERNVTKFSPRKVLKLIAWGKLTFDERVVLHRAVIEGPCCSGKSLPHGGVRPFHHKSTCPAQLTLGPYVVQIWSRYARKRVPSSWGPGSGCGR